VLWRFNLLYITPLKQWFSTILSHQPLQNNQVVGHDLHLSMFMYTQIMWCIIRLSCFRDGSVSFQVQLYVQKDMAANNFVSAMMTVKFWEGLECRPLVLAPCFVFSIKHNIALVNARGFSLYPILCCLCESFSFQVWTHVPKDMIANTFVSKMVILMSACVTVDICWMQTPKRAHVRIFYTISWCIVPGFTGKFVSVFDCAHFPGRILWRIESFLQVWKKSK